MTTRPLCFFTRELRHQQAWCADPDNLVAESRVSPRGPRFVASGLDNLWPPLRPMMRDYLVAKDIKPHRDLAHLLSSQAACFNFLGPFMIRPAALADLLRPVLGDDVAPILLPGEEGFVAFEYVSGPDYLNEAGKSGARQRGAQCTSVDAAVGFERNGRRELLLIEWKYTESYGQPLPNSPRADAAQPDSNAVRRARYRDMFESGVVKPSLTLDDFFWEPFYQLLRQQMLARAIEADTDAPESAFDRVTLAHISPTANFALKKVTSKSLRDSIGDAPACEGWSKLLRNPDRYIPVSSETLFDAFPFDRHSELAGWRDYMLARYAFLAG